MKIITKYILKQMALGFVLITAGLLMIVWLSQSLRLLDMLLNSKASALLFVRLTMLIVPGYLSIISPLALFAVTLFTYNRMISDRELTILRATGQSPLQLAKPVICMGVLFTILGFYISLVVVPNSVAMFRGLRWQIQNDVSHLLLQEGEFSNITSGITVYIRKKADDGTLEGILLQDSRSPKTQVTLLAQKGSIVYKDGTPQISMENGSRQEVTKKNGRFSILYFDSYGLDFSSLSKKSGARSKNPGEMSLKELLGTSQENTGNEKTIRRFHVEAHKRIAYPFYNLSFMLMAAVGLLTGTFNRRGHGSRVIATVLSMATLQIVILGIENLAMKNLAFVPLIYFFALVPIAVCLLILKYAGLIHAEDVKQRALAWCVAVRSLIKKKGSAR